MSKLFESRKDPCGSTASADAVSEESVQRIALDPDIPTLATVLDPAELAQLIGGLPASQWPFGAPKEVRVKLLKWHWGMRCTFEIVMPMFEGPGLIGKVYATDRPDVYHVMEGLQQAGFGPKVELSTPRPVAYIPPLRLLLQAKVEGTVAKEIFTFGPQREQTAAVKRCAQWLARFHALAPRSGRAFELGKELSLIQPSSQQLAGMGELLAGKSMRLFRRLEAAATTSGRIELCAGHGSYSAEHVILDGRRATTIDWDRFDLGDPARDVARFVVALQRIALGRLRSFHALDSVAEAFEKAYQVAGGQEVEAHLPFFRAVTCLTFAIRYFNHRVRHWENKAEALVDEGFRTLEQQASRSGGRMFRFPRVIKFPPGSGKPTDAGIEVSVLPAGLDPGIPTLSAALDPVELATRIALLPASKWAWGHPREVRVEVLRRHPGRHCTFGIEVRTESGLRSLIGKVYAKDAKGVHQGMERLWRAGFGQEAEVSIPRPIAYLPSLRLHLQEKVEGLEARRIFKYGDQRLRGVAAERCARWLARFHTLAPHSGPTTGVEKMLERSERWGRLVSQESGTLADKTHQLVERLRAAAPCLSSVPMCAGHADFGCQNIIFAGRRTVTFDWDAHDVADPTRDVATFMVSLERQALQTYGSVRELDGVVEGFLEAYLALAPATFRILENLPFYKAALCLRSAKKEVSLRTLEWHRRAEALLDEGFRTLEKSVAKERVQGDPRLRG